jgi:hypothetical protein
MNPTQLQQLYSKQAGIHYNKSDREKWKFNLWCNLSMYGKDGRKKYERGTTLAIADEHGISEDTVEVSGNSYQMFREMCELDEGKFRSFVFSARSLKYVYTSHFRALWEAKERRNLSVADCLSLLVDVVQAEGSISSRKIDRHAQERFGDTRDWTYYAARANKELTKTLGQPDLPNDPEFVGSAYYVVL